MSHFVCLMQRKDGFFCSGWRDPCNLSGVQLARKFMKFNSFICLTYHLSDNLKIRHRFSPTTYANLTFSFYLCNIHYSCPYDPLNKIKCFALVNFTQFFQKRFCYRGFCWWYMRNSLTDDIVFILMEFRNAKQHIQNFRYKMFFCMFKFCLVSNYSNSVLLMRILLLQIYPVCATV